MKGRKDKISETGDGTKNSREIMTASAKENEKTIVNSQRFMKLVLEPNLPDTKTKELIVLESAITTGCKRCIEIHVEKALDAGASGEEILRVASILIGGESTLSSVTELLKILRYEENKRAEWISVVDDVREE